MRILVTGGAGFIGSHVVDAYIGLGHEVAVLDDLSRGFRRNLNAKVDLFNGDIEDRSFVQRVFTEFKPEVVNHHAAQMDVRRGVREPLFDARVNILGSLNLIEEAVAHQTRHFIYISTAGAAYGEPEHLPAGEDAPVNPITPYGVSKHTVEHYLYTFACLYGITYTVLRYGNVYGPRQSSKGEAGVFAIFCEQILAGIQPVIYGDGSKMRDYVFVSDVVQANIAALSHGYGEIFNIGSGQPTSDLQVFSLLCDLLNKPKLQPRYISKRAGEIDQIYLNIGKAQRLLGWSPKVRLADGSRQTVDYFKQTAEMEAHVMQNSSAS
ncbi:MAG TPA: NAD-dependent epimerase/dehydratase family protein [Terriglobales bacterium]|nr:NAD-dependent epimerase/dehydratase family protein [Terriglobales bacterium]